MSIEVLFVRKLLLVDLKLRCIRPDFDDFRSENVKSANHRPVFPSKLEYRPLIGWKTGVRIALTLLLLCNHHVAFLLSIKTEVPN